MRRFMPRISTIIATTIFAIAISISLSSPLFAAPPTAGGGSTSVITYFYNVKGYVQNPAVSGYPSVLWAKAVYYPETCPNRPCPAQHYPVCLFALNTVGTTLGDSDHPYLEMDAYLFWDQLDYWDPNMQFDNPTYYDTLCAAVLHSGNCIKVTGRLVDRPDILGQVWKVDSATWCGVPGRVIMG